MKILFDTTQNERGQIFVNFRILSSTLQSLGHQIGALDSFPIKYSSIMNADLLVFLCPDGSKLYEHEIKALLRFVDKGGRIAIFSNSGGDRGLNTNLNEFLKHFELELISTQVIDRKNNCFNSENIPLITNFTGHPINDGIKTLAFSSGCSIRTGKNAVILAKSSETSDPPHSTVFALSAHKKGEIFISGSYIMFADIEAGISSYNNRKFISNVFRWLDPKDKLLEQTYKLRNPTAVLRSQIEEKKEDKTMDEKSKKLEEAIMILEEIEREINELEIEDAGYREILLTNLAKKRGIDYARLASMIEQKDQKQKEETTHPTSSVSAKEDQTKKAQQAKPVEEVNKIHETRVKNAASSKLERKQINKNQIKETEFDKQRRTITLDRNEEKNNKEVLVAIEALNRRISGYNKTIITLLKEILKELKDK